MEEDDATTMQVPPWVTLEWVALINISQGHSLILPQIRTHAQARVSRVDRTLYIAFARLMPDIAIHPGTLRRPFLGIIPGHFANDPSDVGQLKPSDPDLGRLLAGSSSGKAARA